MRFNVSICCFIPFLFVLCFSELSSKAQNLVENGGFELYSSCPDSMSQVRKCVGWSSNYNTPDYFNCSFNGTVQQSFAYAGNGHVGMLGGNFTVFTKDPYNELIKTRLKSPLKKSKKYLIKFQLGLGLYNPPDSIVDFGFYFYPSSKPLTYSGFGSDCFPEVPQILINSFELLQYQYLDFKFCYEPNEDMDSLLIGPFCNSYTSSAPNILNYYMLDELSIEEIKAPEISLTDSLLCDSGFVSFSVPFNPNQYDYYWSFEGGSPSFVALNADPDSIFYNVQGIYDVTLVASTYCGVDTFYYNDKIEVTSDDFDLIDDTSVVRCIDQSVTLKINTDSYLSILWSTGATTDQINVKSDGEYFCTAVNQCKTVTDSINVISEVCDCDIYVPNAFSPNDDGINDVLKLYGNSAINSFQIFNRFGQLLFRSSDLNSDWDGSLNGVQVQMGVYVYSLNYIDCFGSAMQKSGTITVMF